MKRPFAPNSIGADLPASLVVFLVALPLCLGIALASGAPLMSGVITGIVGGIVTGAISGSALAVSGPAAGLTVIVLSAIEDLGSFEAFLVAVVLAGAIQVALGFGRAGIIGSFIPDSVIKGMLAAIGLILILKQIPHAFGVDPDPEGDMAFAQPDGENTFSELVHMFGRIETGALVISVLSLLLLIAWEKRITPHFRALELVPGPLLVVLLGAGMNLLYAQIQPDWVLETSHLVSLPTGDTMTVIQNLPRPDWSVVLAEEVWIVAITIAVVASLETLLSLEATDRLDPAKRIAPTNLELKAQGVGNMVAGFFGGLPMTAVIVRSSANVTANAQTKASAILHGVWLLVAVLFVPHWMNQIPLSALAAILLTVGFKLTRPSIYRSVWVRGWDQFIPFIVTISAILLTDLLVGILVGLAVGLVFVSKSNYHAGLTVTVEEDRTVFHLNQVVSFLNKQQLRSELQKIEDGAKVVFDAAKVEFLDNDIIDTIEDFVDSASERDIQVQVIRRQDSTRADKKLDPLAARTADIAA